MASTSPGPLPTFSAVARMNRIPVATRSHKIWVFLLCGVFMFELADLNTFGFAAPALIKHWGASVGAIGGITSAAFFGMFVGALVGGRVADRVGRKRALIGASAFYSIFSLLSAASINLPMLGVFRVLTGVGMEAMTVVGLTYVSEMYPRTLRGRYQALILGVGLIGIPGMSWFARWAVPLGPNGWRLIFVLGAFGLVVAVLMITLLPESIRWQEGTGRKDEAEALLSKLEDEARAKTGGELPEPSAEQAVTTPGRLSELFRGRYVRRTVVLCVVWVFGILGFYGFNGWIPTLLVEHGYGTLESLTYTSIVTLGVIPGALLAWPITDRWERKFALLAFEIILGVLVLIYGFVPVTAVILVVGFLISMFLQTQTAFLYAYTPEVFPTRLRGVGSGLPNGMGRLAGFAGGFLVAGIFGGFGYTAVFIYVMAALVLAGLILAVFGERTSRRALEDIGETTETERVTPPPAGERAPVRGKRMTGH
ncbi:MAG: MFS transporter [Streptosporangiaceae bacterium]